ncbi:MAG: DUF881 domain-containing protein [Tetrasphaera sp.]|nr:DUF881 domain-containing protein [Tetrasphaera sp.]
MTEPGERRYSMTLLTEMLERPLDPGYAAAAERREQSGEPRGGRLATPLAALGALLIGLTGTVAAVTLSGADTSASRSRSDLIARVEAKRVAAERLSTEVANLRAEVDALEARSVSGDPGRSAEIRALTAAAGGVALEGPGVRIILDDAPGSDPADPNAAPRDAGSGGDTGRVSSRDLQFVTNALWQAGAEAVAINGQRLSATSAIRFAGSAVLVNFRPLERPYTLTALGPPGSFPAAFADGEGGRYLSTLRSTFGIRVDTVVARTLRVPAAVTLTTRYSTTLDNGTRKDDT